MAAAAIPIVGGRVSGAYTGKVLPGGADWQTIWPDGRLELEAHYALDIDGHGLVEVLSSGVRHGPPDVLAALARGEAVDPTERRRPDSRRASTAFVQQRARHQAARTVDIPPSRSPHPNREPIQLSIRTQRRSPHPWPRNLA